MEVFSTNNHSQIVTSEYLGRHFWAERVAAVLTVEDVLPPKLAIKSNLNFSALLVAPPLWWTPQNRKRERVRLILFWTL